MHNNIQQNTEASYSTDDYARQEKWGGVFEESTLEHKIGSTLQQFEKSEMIQLKDVMELFEQISQTNFTEFVSPLSIDINGEVLDEGTTTVSPHTYELANVALNKKENNRRLGNTDIHSLIAVYNPTIELMENRGMETKEIDKFKEFMWDSVVLPPNL